jgi:hypothetical protein
MDRIFRKIDGTLYIKCDYPHLKGVFLLQIVSPMYNSVDQEEFKKDLDRKIVREYNLMDDYESYVEHSEDHYDYDEFGEDRYYDNESEEDYYLNNYGVRGWESPSGDAFFPEDWNPV